MKHKHKAESYRDNLPYQGSVVSCDQNPAAHGGRRIVEYCECGAERHTNYNLWHEEVGPWYRRPQKTDRDYGTRKR